MNTTALYLGLIFGSIGLGYFVYGKKQKKQIALAAGIGLMIVPYAISNIPILVGVCLGFMVLPFFIRI